MLESGVRVAVPIDVKDLIAGGVVEDVRTEYKRGWNPERILHTICAFANDLDAYGGGYIVVGVDYENGYPEVVGLDRSAIDGMLKELVGMTNLIEPYYGPVTEVCDVDGRTVLVLWCPTGPSRPYSCPTRYSNDGVKGERAPYVRKMSSTIRAKRDDERRLYDDSRRHPFDLEVNHSASIGDIRDSLVMDFLYRVRSSLYQHPPNTKAELCSNMRIVDGPPEDLRPLNVGLMFFNDQPHRFFERAFIDLVDKPVPTGDGMTEMRFTGPLDRQIIDALNVLENRYIQERVYKSDDVPQARRIKNYPVVAVRELLVNAVYHKSYEIWEPVRVTITPDSIEFLNYPGPSRKVSDEDLRSNRISVGIYRNLRVGDYLKELDLAESRFTGLPKVVKALEDNGSPPLRIVTDEDRSYFKAILSIHPDFLRTSEPEGETMEERIMSLLESRGCMSVGSICEALGYRSVNKRVKGCIDGMIADGTVSLLYPDKPRSPKQRICLPNRS